MRRDVRKPDFCICKNKDADQLLCFRYTDSTIPLLPKYKDLKAKFQCHPARCLLPVEIMQRCGLATGPATVEILPYLLPY